MGGVEYQVTKVDPTDPHTKGAVYQVHKVSEEVAATLGGKVYRARIINDPTAPTVAGKVYQIVLIDDPEDPAVKGKVYNAILTGGSEAVVVGPAVSPLSLPDAIANSLSYVKAFGGTEQNGTPTPDVPVDIVSNNGVLKARHQSSLPLGYTLLDYIQSNGTQYIDLGIKGNGNTKVSVEYRYHTNTSASGSGRVFGSRTTSSSNAFAIGSASGVVSATGNKVFWCYDSQSYFVVDDPTFPIGDWQTVVFSATEHTLNGVSYGDDYNVVEFETPQNLKLFGFDNNGTMGYGQVDIARCKLWDNGVLIRDLVPCKNASNVIGMYDLVSGQFFTNQGTGTFTAGNPVSDPIEIYTDGTVETINAHGKNIFNKDDAQVGKNWNDNTMAYSIAGGYIPAKKGDAFTLSISDMPKYATTTWAVLDSNYTYLGTASDGSAITQDDCAYIRLSIRCKSSDTWTQSDLDDAKIQLEKGSTATAYQPYFDGGTATAEMLLKVGDYQDEQQILSGAVTRKVGVKVLDGTENWVANTVSSGRLVFYITKASIGSNSTVLPSGSPNIKCSHFETSTAAAQSLYGTVWAGGTAINFTAGDFCANLTAWKQWLADQYAAGTPVILVYPLATPTTESVTGQALQVTDGDNVLEITQASLTGLELEAEYEKEAV